MIMSDRLTYTVSEAGELLGISRAQAYLMVKLGRLPVIRLGRRIVVPRVALMKMLESVMPES
jgi:excisionase family DNA binding protein